MSSAFKGLSSWTKPVVETLQVYQTAKIVELKDRPLGFVYYGLLFLVVLFVVGYEILYCNDQFEKRDVTGTPILNVQHPTLDGCTPSRDGCLSDFTPLTDLPYCEAFVGNSSSYSPRQRRPCLYADEHTLVPNPVSGNSLFVPTRIDEREEVRDCQPDPANNYTCRNEFEIVNRSGVRYVADIERYTLLLGHSYKRDTISGNNNALEGSYLECQGSAGGGFMHGVSRAIFGESECPGGYIRRDIPCIIPGGCGRRGNGRSSLLQQQGKRRAPGLVGKRGGRLGLAQALELEEMAQSREAFAISDGDVFSVGKLMDLAGVSLDTTRNSDGEPLREAGTVLDIQVVYNNLHAFSSTFGNTKVEYWYKVAARPLHQVKQESVAWTDVSQSRRRIENRHGIEIVVQVQGTFGFFSIMNFLLMLTTASAMLAVATVLTDKLAIYAMAKGDTYREKKYESVTFPDEDEGEKEPEDLKA